MKKVGICFHPQWPAAQALAQEVKGALAPHVSEVWLTSAWDEGEARLNLEGTDLLICVGGDGTMLWAARLVILQHTLLLGINMGRLGFLAELRAEEALAKANKGEEFGKLAGEYSDDVRSSRNQGQLGRFARRGMVKPFSDAAFALKPGQLSAIVETPFGYHIIKRTE